MGLCQKSARGVPKRNRSQGGAVGLFWVISGQGIDLGFYGGALGGCGGEGHPSERVHARKEYPQSACPRCKLRPPIWHRGRGCNNATKQFECSQLVVWLEIGTLICRVAPASFACSRSFCSQLGPAQLKPGQLCNEGWGGQ
eukprot:1160422-Pelagomonas_calceolata.AAC.10